MTPGEAFVSAAGVPPGETESGLLARGIRLTASKKARSVISVGQASRTARRWRSPSSFSTRTAPRRTSAFTSRTTAFSGLFRDA